MAKTESTNTRRSATVRRGTQRKFKGAREILFPTEPSTIGHERIDRAIERVTSRRK